MGDSMVSPMGLWEHLSSEIPGAELNEIELMVGRTLIDRNAMIREECTALASILHEYIESTDELQQNVDAGSVFPDMPAKKLLENEVKVIARNLRERAMKRGQIFTLNLSSSDTATFKAVMDNVPGFGGGTASISNRPPTRDEARQARGVGTGSRGGRRPRSRPTSAPVQVNSITDADVDVNTEFEARNNENSTVSDVTDADSKSLQRPSSEGTLGMGYRVDLTTNDDDEFGLGLPDFESISSDIKQGLEEEYELLLADSEFISGLLEAEHDFRMQLEDTIEHERKKKSQLLSLGALKSLRMALQKLWQDDLINVELMQTNVNVNESQSRNARPMQLHSNSLQAQPNLPKTPLRQKRVGSSSISAVGQMLSAHHHHHQRLPGGGKAGLKALPPVAPILSKSKSSGKDEDGTRTPSRYVQSRGAKTGTSGAKKRENEMKAHPPATPPPRGLPVRRNVSRGASASNSNSNSRVGRSSRHAPPQNVDKDVTSVSVTVIRGHDNRNVNRNRSVRNAVRGRGIAGKGDSDGSLPSI